MVIVHGPNELDRLAIQLAEAERVPLILSMISSVDELVRVLNEFSTSVVVRKSERRQ
jgi:putative transcriptional regulator